VSIPMGGTLISVLLLAACDVAGARPATQAARGTATIPLERFRGLLLVPVATPDGRQYRLIVDTGAATAIVLFQPDRGQSSSTSITTLPFVLVGNLRHGIVLTHPEVTRMATALASSFDGVIGLTLFSQHTVEFDLAAGFLKVHEQRPTRKAQTSCTVPFRIMHGVPIVTARVGASDSVDLLVDTGSNAALTLDVPMTGERDGRTVLGTQTTGVVYGQATPSQAVQFGTCNFSDVPTILRERQGPGAWQGSVGLRMWSGADRLEVDFVHRRLTLIQAACAECIS